MTPTPQPSQAPALDPASEVILALEQEGFPQTDYGAFSFTGPCDRAALDQAFQQAQAAWPRMHAHLGPVRAGFGEALAWRVSQEMNSLQVRDCSTADHVPDDLEAWVHQHMAGEVDHCLDLAREFPAKLMLFLLPGDRGCIVLLFHHVVMDAGGFYTFMRDVFRLYHRLVTGAEPDWGGAAGMHAQAGGARPVEAISTRQFLAAMAAEFRKYPRSRMAQIESRPQGQTGRTIVRHIIGDSGLQQALRERARREDGTVTDLVMAASKLALDEFNTSRGAPPDILYHCLGVNQRLRQASSEVAGQGNPVSLIGIPSDREDRKDPQGLLRHVVSCRTRKLAMGRDVAAGRVAHAVLRAGRVLPLNARYGLLRALLEMRISFYLANLGVVWPRIEDGRPTGETAVRRVGAMELVDIHSSVGTSRKNANALLLRTFLGRFYLVSLIGRHQVADRDAEEFSSLVVKKLMAYL